MSCVLNISLANLSEGESIFDPAVKPWIVSSLAISVGQNVIVTSLIVYKILSVNRRATGKSHGTLGKTAQMLVESGALYVVTVFVYLMTYVANNNAQFFMIDILNPVIGITFSLLVVRVAIRRSNPLLSIEDADPPSQEHPTVQSIVVSVHQTRVSEGMDSVSDLELGSK
ncbi:hypothetical protein DACRYDRAFT_19931 [Dacryopinax primogenitus]|uniref:Uncharacterized protein n=1 Tax=Dacryopinax primogenitus (strain DJM 731) TaxID=1858805 RepID=M5GGG1_DACPD|nr:uncharacterized protein DACRYDRAFT_19931 [Dacryopinax primogenitus]EJU05428.1 hypothetical protein DACRYDRAFT_19931 [Dacryopinax primogenitus]